FHAMFYGNFNERNKKEIELKDIDCKEFIDILNLIYPSYNKITNENAEYLLKLGDQFQIKMIIDQVEEFLISSSAFNVTRKFKLADQYRLIKLQAHCLDTLKSIKDVTDLKTSEGYTELSDRTFRTLFEKIVKLNSAT
ncbi:hypothetical protein PENTCL1PPCAC_18913, partial [Pristionchus entomophagus]